MHQTQTVELTQHYDGIVMRLKDRIIALEASKSSSPSNASDSVTPTNAEAGESNQIGARFPVYLLTYLNSQSR